MNTLKSNIEEAVLREYDSIWKFCRAIENDEAIKEGDFTDSVNRTAYLLAQAIRDWSSSRQYARKCYEDMMRSCQNNINTINNNQTIFWGLDTGRVDEHNAKATAQIEVIKVLAYIIGLDTDTVSAILTTATRFAQGNIIL